MPLQSARKGSFTELLERGQFAACRRPHTGSTEQSAPADDPLSFFHGVRRSQVVSHVQATLVHETFFREGGLDAQVQWKQCGLELRRYL